MAPRLRFLTMNQILRNVMLASGMDHKEPSRTNHLQSEDSKSAKTDANTHTYLFS